MKYHQPRESNRAITGVRTQPRHDATFADRVARFPLGADTDRTVALLFHGTESRPLHDLTT